MIHIKDLTLEQRVGQLMMIGWQSANSTEIVELIKKYHFGNIILFTRNIKNVDQLKELTRKIQEAAIKYNGVAAFISLDQEGGSVRRVYDGVTSVPGHMAIGASHFHRPKAAFEVGSIIGMEMKELGVNFVLAPVADVNNNAQNPIIAIRSFSDNAFIVSKLANDFASGLKTANVLSSYKHFIGHGNVNVDSHLDLPYLNSTLDEMKKMELIPYINNHSSDAIMTSHILYKAIDDRFPGSISEKVIKGLLRDELQYEGLVVTDCFEMDAILRAYALPEAAVYAIKATTDIITVSHTFSRQLRVRQGILDAIQNNNIDMRTINKSVSRILFYKEKYCKEIDLTVDKTHNNKIANDISLTSVTKASGTIFDVDNNTVIVGVSNYVNSNAEDVNVEKMDFAKTMGEYFKVPYVSIDSKNINIRDLIPFVKGKKVVLGLTDSHLILVQRVLYNNVLKYAKELMLVSLRTPYDILGQNEPNCHICLYEYTRLSLQSFIKVLDSKIAKGKLPVRIDNKREKSHNQSHLMEGVLSYIEQNYNKKLTLDIVGNEFFISGGYLSYLFKHKMSTTFLKHLNQVRINKAKDLLHETHYLVYEIGVLCGFRDPNYFSRLFTSTVGLTPKIYREQVRPEGYEY